MAFIGCRLHLRVMSRSTNKNAICPPPAITRSLIIAEQTEYRGAERTPPVKMFLTNAAAG
jgi:hypothetical protein